MGDSAKLLDLAKAGCGTLDAIADDPMWADHVEMRKETVRQTAKVIRELVNALSTARLEGERSGMERAAKIAELWDGKPCRPNEAWPEIEAVGYNNGQLDASSSIAAAIRAEKDGLK